MATQKILIFLQLHLLPVVDWIIVVFSVLDAAAALVTFVGFV